MSIYYLKLKSSENLETLKNRIIAEVHQQQYDSLDLQYEYEWPIENLLSVLDYIVTNLPSSITSINFNNIFDNRHLLSELKVAPQSLGSFFYKKIPPQITSLTIKKGKLTVENFKLLLANLFSTITTLVLANNKLNLTRQVHSQQLHTGNYSQPIIPYSPPEYFTINDLETIITSIPNTVETLDLSNNGIRTVQEIQLILNYLPSSISYLKINDNPFILKQDVLNTFFETLPFNVKKIEISNKGHYRDIAQHLEQIFIAKPRLTIIINGNFCTANNWRTTSISLIDTDIKESFDILDTLKKEEFYYKWRIEQLEQKIAALKSNLYLLPSHKNRLQISQLILSTLESIAQATIYTDPYNEIEKFAAIKNNNYPQQIIELIDEVIQAMEIAFPLNVTLANALKKFTGTTISFSVNILAKDLHLIVDKTPSQVTDIDFSRIFVKESNLSFKERAMPIINILYNLPSTVTRLNLAENNLGSETANDLTFLFNYIELRDIENLDLSNNELDTLFFTRDEQEIALINEALSKNTQSLQTINLSGNKLLIYSVVNLRKILFSLGNPTVKFIIDDKTFTKSEWLSFIDELPDLQAAIDRTTQPSLKKNLIALKKAAINYTALSYNEREHLIEAAVALINKLNEQTITRADVENYTSTTNKLMQADSANGNNIYLDAIYILLLIIVTILAAAGIIVLNLEFPLIISTALLLTALVLWAVTEIIWNTCGYNREPEVAKRPQVFFDLKIAINQLAAEVQSIAHLSQENNPNAYLPSN